MAIRIGESNKLVRVSSSGYDMSSYTDIKINFTAPGGGTDFTVATADGVVLGTSNVVDDDLGSLQANEYAEYPVTATSFDVSGDWVACLEYQDNTTSPTTIFIGTDAEFEVLDAC